MKNRFLHILFLLLYASVAMAQERIVESLETHLQYSGPPVFQHQLRYAGKIDFQGEELTWYRIDPVYIMPPLVFANEKEARKYYEIANNIKKVYPIAVEISHDVRKHIEYLDSLTDKKQRDKYINDMEKELKAKYTPRCKKLTKTQGKLLIKLVDRQCDQTAFKLVRIYMGSFKATFWNTFATILGASLKKEYDPEVDDRITERCILLIESGQM